MKEIVNFLRQVYSGSTVDVANILTAEADNNKERLLIYLGEVKRYVDSLIIKIYSL